MCRKPLCSPPKKAWLSCRCSLRPNSVRFAIGLLSSGHVRHPSDGRTSPNKVASPPLVLHFTLLQQTNIQSIQNAISEDVKQRATVLMCFVSAFVCVLFVYCMCVGSTVFIPPPLGSAPGAECPSQAVEWMAIAKRLGLALDAARRLKRKFSGWTVWFDDFRCSWRRSGSI